MKSASTRQAACMSAAVLLAITLAGCQLNVAGLSQPAANDGVAALEQTDYGPSSDSPQKAYNTKNDDAVITVKGAAENASSETDPNATTAASSGTSKSDKPAPSAKEGAVWDAKSPRLLGLALGELKTEAAAKLGKPLDAYPLEDGTDKLGVDEYAAFSVGYGSDKKIVFVEVFDKAADPGLGGIRVGDSGSAAVKALGKPSTRTSSVIAYESDEPGGAMLKLDLDPQKNRIVSIKLFSADRQPQSQ